MGEWVAVVAGATGLVGQELVRQLSADGAWREVRALVRRPLPPELTARTVRTVQVDYDHLDDPSWARADHVFCALGTTMRRAGSEAAFERIDLGYPVALAQSVLAQGARHFLLVSALGAAAESRVFYNRVKGELEISIMSLGFRSVTIARPAILLGPRPEQRFGEQLGKVLSMLGPPRWRPVRATQVARALLDAAKRDLPGLRILENQQLRAFALALLLAGCGAGWRTTPLAPGPLPPRQQAQVWTQGHALRWHALVITTDSISGVPFTRAPACDSCRVGVPRGAVDSVRLGNPAAGFWKSVGLGMGISFAAALASCRFERCQLGD